MKLFNYWPWLAILVLSSLIVWPLFLPGYFTHHDDLQVMRIFEMKRCIQDLQIPCRWVPDMGYGNGYPLFNYYNPLPYYIGGLLSFFLSFLISAKILFFIPLILGGLSMYLLAKEILDKQAGFLAACLYLFAPYRALDSYVRGAVAESFAIALIPLVLYFALRVIKDQSRKYLIYLAFSLAAFLTSHTIMTLLFAPLLLFMIVYWVKTEKRGLYVVYGLLLGIGLSAFFTVPAFLEKNLVQIDNLTKLDLDFRAHFVTLPQLFLDRSWGYGASFLGPSDTISFQIGWPHWMLALLSVPFILLLFKREDKKRMIFYLGIFTFFCLSLFMTHNKSAVIWEKIGMLRFTQFPWRFLAVAIFTSSILGGFLIFNLKGYLKKAVTILLVLITVFLNWSYFRPDKFIYDLTDQQKLSGRLWETQQKASILDYLPKGAGEPIEPAPEKPIIRSGEADIKNFEKTSNEFKLSLEVSSPARVEIPVMDFPNWIVFENGVKIKHTNDNYVRRISLDLQKGNYQLRGKFTNTPVRTAANLITVVSLGLILYPGIYGKIRKNYQ